MFAFLYEHICGANYMYGTQRTSKSNVCLSVCDSVLAPRPFGVKAFPIASEFSFVTATQLLVCSCVTEY
jgi:hypothetical protein